MHRHRDAHPCQLDSMITWQCGCEELQRHYWTYCTIYSHSVCNKIKFPKTKYFCCVWLNLLKFLKISFEMNDFFAGINFDFLQVLAKKINRNAKPGLYFLSVEITRQRFLSCCWYSLGCDPPVCQMINSICQSIPCWKKVMDLVVFNILISLQVHIKATMEIHHTLHLLFSFPVITLSCLSI